MSVQMLAAYMVAGGLLAAILVVISYLPFGYWNESFLGLIAAVAIFILIFGGVILFLAATVIGIAREW